MRTDQFSTHAPGRLIPVMLRQRRAQADGSTRWVDVPASAFVPRPLPPEVDWARVKGELFDAFSRAERALARLDGLERGVPDAKVVLRSLLFKEAKLSSKIEDIVTTAEDMALAAAGRAMDPDAPGSEAANYIAALEHALASPLPFCQRLICEMHAELLRDVRGGEKRPGHLRDIAVYIGDAELGPERARFVPPPPGEELLGALAALERYMNEEAGKIPLLARAALMHYQFEAIHPFRDGNGRIGRALLSRQLCADGYLRNPLVHVSGYIEATKRRYADLLLGVSTSGAWVEWIAYMLEAFRSQAVAACAACERLIGLHDDYQRRLHGAGAKPRVFRLVDRLFSLPVINAREAAAALDVSDPTARADIRMLVDLGVLAEISGRSWGQDWVSKDILAAIESDDAAVES
ncbi:MAG: Fic family protein [Phycisphaerales bacterium]|nr:Fic family protein [Phycisphaerales bacterium]